MRVQRLHNWKLSSRKAIEIQRTLRDRVSKARLRRKVRSVAGVDVGIRGGDVTAAVVVLSFPGLEVQEVRVARRPVSFPYVPGLLSFRELPAISKAFSQLRLEPDLVLVDGHGIAHPRRLGIASHFGLLLDCPTVGCAKSRLCGEHDEPELERGSRRPLVDKDKVIGAVVRTRDRVKPVFASVGHKIVLDQAVEYVFQCGAGYRLPEPTRLAHQAAAGQLKA